MLCDRCKKDAYKYDICKTCGRKICNSCMKSSRRLNKLVRIAICKDCWSSMPKRKIYKTETLVQAPIASMERPPETRGRWSGPGRR